VDHQAKIGQINLGPLPLGEFDLDGIGRIVTASKC
jgi:hypothetical protein